MDWADIHAHSLALWCQHRWESPMLTKLILQNFKRFEDAEIPLDQAVVFVGPNNSGKTTALQALALWDLGAKRWLEKKVAGSKATQRTAATLGRSDLSALPLPDMGLLWRNRRIRRGVTKEDRKGTENIRIKIQVEGQDGQDAWRCGLEFDFANDESIYCRPALDGAGTRMEVPPAIQDLRVAFLPPMSGLSDPEFVKQPGEIGYLVGQGRTADVLRNLCSRILMGPDGQARWDDLCRHINRLFGIELQPPDRLPNDQLTLSYKERDATLDISCSGRGLQQSLLLLTHLYAHPRSIWLLDEPDAHLEFVRQGQTYDLIAQVAQDKGCQVIIATHSEKVLNSAAERHQVVAFIGKPHGVGGRASQLMKALKDIPFDEYLQAEQLGWVLYIEGSTDLAILRAFAARLNHLALADLEQVFWKPVFNQQSKAEEHFEGMKEAIPGLRAFLLLDRQDAPKPDNPRMTRHLWERKEIENYLCQPATLLAYAGHLGKSNSAGPLFEAGTIEPYQAAMQEALTDRLGQGPLKDPDDPFWKDNKVSEELLPHLLSDFATRLGIYNALSKGDFHVLVNHIPDHLIAKEISQVLDLIHQVAVGELVHSRNGL